MKRTSWNRYLLMRVSEQWAEVKPQFGISSSLDWVQYERVYRFLQTYRSTSPQQPYILKSLIRLTIAMIKSPITMRGLSTSNTGDTYARPLGIVRGGVGGSVAASGINQVRIAARPKWQLWNLSGAAVLLFTRRWDLIIGEYFFEVVMVMAVWNARYPLLWYGKLRSKEVKLADGKEEGK